LQTFLQVLLLLSVSWLFTNQISSHVVLAIACFLSYINNYQQTAAHNVVIDKLNGIEGSLCKIQDNLKWFKPNDKHRSLNPIKSYEDVLTFWNEFKKFFDAKKKTRQH
jgi:hypothetical protein